MHKGQMLNARVDRPQELDTSFINEDGFKRNLAKFKWERIWARHWAKQSPASHGWIFTAVLNGMVERFRYAPYLYGHVVFVASILQIIGAIAWAF